MKTKGWKAEHELDNVLHLSNHLSYKNSNIIMLKKLKTLIYSLKEKNKKVYIVLDNTEIKKVFNRLCDANKYATKHNYIIKEFSVEV